MEKIVKSVECRNCGTIHWPRIDNEGNLSYSKLCKNQKCKSPYWNKNRVR